MASRLVAAPDIDAAPLEDGGAVLYHAASGKFMLLNRASSILWAELASPQTEEMLAAKLCESYEDLSPATARQDVREAVEQLRSLALIQPLDDEASVVSCAEVVETWLGFPPTTSRRSPC